MIRSALAAFAFLLLSCSTSQERKHEALMNEIEASIRLPSGAGPLESYARYYTEYRGEVIGAYTTEVEAPRSADYGCEELLANDKSKPVGCPAPADVRPGQRRWVKFEDYPAVAGEKCTAIQLVFDPRARKIKDVRCVEASY
jgi:hypothetical protein